MQGRVGHRDPTDEHGAQARHRRDCAGASDLHLDILDLRQLLLGGKLVRDREARRTRHKAQSLLGHKGVDLVDHTVDVVGQIRAQAPDALVIAKQAVSAAYQRALRAHRQSQHGEPVQQCVVGRRQRRAVDRAATVGEKAQRPLGGHLRVKLTQAAGGGVARVDERLLAGRRLAQVDLGKCRLEQQNFPAHLDQWRRISRQPQRNRADGPYIGGDVFARLTVAAGGGARQHAILVGQAHGQAIELEFNGVLDAGVHPGQVDCLGHPLVERAQFGLVERIRERKHWDTMGYLGERRERCATDALGRGVRGPQFRVRFLEAAQFARQAIVVRIRHDRPVQHVIGVVVACDFLPQIPRA